MPPGAGIPAFYTPTTVGTVLAEGKETREFDGRTYVMEPWLKADFALVKCKTADAVGNLTFNKTARNFSPIDVHGRHHDHRTDREVADCRPAELIRSMSLRPAYLRQPRWWKLPDPVHEDDPDCRGEELSMNTCHEQSGMDQGTDGRAGCAGYSRMGPM